MLSKGLGVKMAIVQCPNNHYYDDKRDSSCPYCKKMCNSVIADVDVNEQPTSYIDPTEIDDSAKLTEGYGETVTEFEKTIGIFVDETQNILTVAWLVCIEGPEKGKSYVIHSGRNFAGRSLDMDIVLSDDNSIAEEKHFSVVYDPKSVMFYLLEGSGNTYINGVAISSEENLLDGDIIQVGQSKYMFIPFCKEGREWN